MEWLGAVQAQDYAGAKWALGQRIPGGTDGDIERAFNKGEILRTHLLRPTWHFVSPADIRWLLMLTSQRVHAANASMYRKLGIDAALVRRSTNALTKALEGGNQLTREALRDALERAGIPTKGELRMGYIMMHAELEGLVCSGPRRGKQFTYALLDERVPRAPALERAEALAELSRRYFWSRGPATVHDFAKWSGLTIAECRKGLDAVQRELEYEVMDGKEYWFKPATAPGGELSSVTAHLLSIYDEYVSGYKDRSAIVTSKNAARLVAIGNALTGIVVVNGQIVGTWKRTFDVAAVRVRLDLFTRLNRVANSAVDAAVAKYGEFLAMQVVQA
ncbi:MAG: winged helix DNA-binding domain-containing protein [Gemmatimonadaceae bacterium]